MGRYKRKTKKIKPKKRFVNTNMVLRFISDNEDKLEDLVQIELREIEWGDEYNSEVGNEYLIFFKDKSAYLIGKTKRIEDGDDWEETHCQDYYQERKVTPLEVMIKLESALN